MQCSLENVTWELQFRYEYKKNSEKFRLGYFTTIKLIQIPFENGNSTINPLHIQQDYLSETFEIGLIQSTNTHGISLKAPNNPNNNCLFSSFATQKYRFLEDNKYLQLQVQSCLSGKNPLSQIGHCFVILFLCVCSVSLSLVNYFVA